MSSLNCHTPIDDQPTEVFWNTFTQSARNRPTLNSIRIYMLHA